MTSPISLSELASLREKMTPLELRVHRCGYQSKGEACGICTGCNEYVQCGGYADVVGSDARDECSHPGSEDNIAGLVATHNAAPALIAIAKAAQASRRPVFNEQDARDQYAALQALDAALRAFSP